MHVCMYACMYVLTSLLTLLLYSTPLRNENVLLGLKGRSSFNPAFWMTSASMGTSAVNFDLPSADAVYVFISER